jgi:nucleoside-diphosphate-sugar epimerase
MDLRGKTIGVTGATGFVGRYIVDVLLQRGAHVVGVVRNPDRVPALRARGVDMRKADLADPEALAKGFAGADAVVSNAALFSVGKMISLSSRGFAEHNRTNIKGTENVFDAIVSAGVKRVVHVSSVAVYDAVLARDASEDYPQLSERSRHTPINAYQISKALSEQLAWRRAEQDGLQLTTVRPCTIYGAFDPNFTPIVKRLLGLPIGIFPVALHIPLVYAGDVAEAIALALEKPVSIGRAYNTTGENGSIWELLEAWKQAGGAAAGIVLPLPMPLTQSFSNARAAIELGWHNRPFVDALRETFALERGGS